MPSRKNRKARAKVDPKEQFTTEQEQLYTELLLFAGTVTVNLSDSKYYGDKWTERVIPEEFVKLSEEDLCYSVPIFVERIVHSPESGLQQIRKYYRMYLVVGTEYDLDYDFFTTHPNNVHIVECHGYKCRKSGEGGIWCTSCYGDLEPSNYSYLLDKVPFSQIPRDSIKYLVLKDTYTYPVSDRNSLERAARIVSTELQQIVQLESVIESAEDKIRIYSEHIREKVQESKNLLEQYSNRYEGGVDGVAQLSAMITEKIYAIRVEEQREIQRLRDEAVREELSKLDQQQAELNRLREEAMAKLSTV